MSRKSYRGCIYMRGGHKLRLLSCPGCGQHMKLDDGDSFSWALKAPVPHFLFLGAADTSSVLNGIWRAGCERRNDPGMGAPT